MFILFNNNIYNMKTATEYLMTTVGPKTDVTKLTARQVANLMEAYAIYYHNGEIHESGKLFDPRKNKPKPDPDDASFSVDVNIIDEDGVHGLAYFCFESNQWKFHTDTLVDYDGAETKWAWYYPVVKVSDINW